MRRWRFSDPLKRLVKRFLGLVSAKIASGFNKAR